MVYKEYIQPPQWGNDVVAQQQIPLYIKNIESFMVRAGLSKSNTLDNMDTDNITIPTTITTGETYIEKSLQFDLSDIGQLENPLRVKLFFGFYRGDIPTDAGNEQPIFSCIKTVVESINNTNNSITSVSTQISGNALQQPTSGNTWFPNIYNSKAESIIINKDGFLAINLHPNYAEVGQGNTPLTDNSLMFLIIERGGGEYANVIVTNNDILTSDFYNYKIGDTYIASIENSYTHFVNTYSIYSNGMVSVFPSFVATGTNTIKQSSNVCVINADAIATGAQLEILVNDEPTKFIAFSGKGSSFFNARGRFLVRVN